MHWQVPGERLPLPSLVGLDRGMTRALTVGAMLVLALTSYASGYAVEWRFLAILVVLTISFDAAVQTSQIAGQRLIFLGPQETRGRVNAIYMTINFIGGAIGSVLGTMTYHWGGWSATAVRGGLIGLLLLAIYVISDRSR